MRLATIRKVSGVRIQRCSAAELAAIAGKLGHIPTVAGYHEAMGIVNKDGAAIYKYLNFNQIEEYVENAKGVAA